MPGLCRHQHTPSQVEIPTKRSIRTVTIEIGEHANKRTFKGVKIAAVLARTEVLDEARRVIFTGADGCTRTVSIKRLLADPDAIISLGPNYTVRSVVPSLPPSFWVKNLVHMEVE
jgi:DMSO/TMAO reductase YedYZ molybdopterin-dependent catalytic subunit